MYGGGSQSGMYYRPGVTRAVKVLLIAIVAVFVLQLALGQFAGIAIERLLGFAPVLFFAGAVWQILTYPFLHGSLTHILFNGMVLYMLGPELERRWGTKRFAWYYAACAVGGAVLQMIIWGISLVAIPSISEFMGYTPIIGASGALYGLFVAFGMLYGNSQVLVFFMFPMRAKNFVILLTAIEVISAVFYTSPQVGGGGVAHLVHLGGLITGYLILRWRGPNLTGGGRGSSGGGMSREEVKRRLSLVVNNEEEVKTGDKGQPITWN
ncbi:MAG TPA: rhomboid family intramembrane serine protease [Bdellovibrionota bacterium]|jgi:membrane associated rhomboid family serine protease|nr:rhomboid family intramembrane serine protease [Bdellovibrionota bacterium]